MSTDLFLLVPVDRYRVEYEVGAGAPFSDFDLAILRTVAEDEAGDLEQIAEMLALPRRLVIESLVELARVGWVSIGARAVGFSVTPLGRAALKDPQAFMPERLYTRAARILMERATGQVSSGRGVLYHTWRSLQDSGEWANYVPLQRDNNILRMDMGSVKALLRRDKNEWVRHIGEPVLQQEVWVKLHVEGDRIHGLPDAWRSTVTARIAHQFERPGLLSARPAFPGRVLRNRSITERTWRGSRDVSALVFGRRRHAELLTRAVNEAKSQVLIASAFINASVIEKDLGPLVIEATRRGVRVDLLWGYSAGEEEESKQRTLDALGRLKRSCVGLNLLRFNDAPSGSHAKLLAWNTADGRFQVCLGSYNWLSVRGGVQADDASFDEVSIVTSNPGIAGDLCTTMASLWVQADTSLLGGSDLWQHTAAHLERRATQELLALRQDVDEPVESEDEGASVPLTEPASIPSESGILELRQIRDQEHESLMREMLLAARTRIGVVSHKVGAKGIVRLASLPRPSEESADGPAVRVAVGEIQEDAAAMMESVEEAVRSASGTFVIHPGLHAKVLLADDSVLVSSYNFLSADPFATSVNAREVGVLIRSSELSDQVWAWIEGMH